MRNARILISIVFCFIFAFPGWASPPDIFNRTGEQSAFNHPGLLNTRTSLADLKARIAGDPAAYTQLMADPRSSADYQPSPMDFPAVAARAIVPSEKTLKDDAMAAYLNALRWAISGDRQHRDAAIRIMDAWAARFKSLVPAKKTPEAQMELEAAWILPMWVNAGEIILHYDGNKAHWDPRPFKAFVIKLESQALPASSRSSNWGASAAMATMAAGVFLDNQMLYISGRERVKALIPLLIKPSGEVFELRSRDCVHPQYSLTAFVQAAQIARNQGDNSIWLLGKTNGAPILAKGLEYMASSLSGSASARDCRSHGKVGEVTAGYGYLAAGNYARLGVKLPLFDRIVKQQGPDGASNQFLGWSMASRP